MRHLKAALIGAGYFGSRHAAKLSELEQVTLVAVIDANPIVANAVASAYGSIPAGEYTPLLSAIDFAIVATPPETHFAIAKECILAGVPVLVEKPLAVDIGQARELVTLAEAHGVPLQVGHVERFNPAFIAAVEHRDACCVIEARRSVPRSHRVSGIGVVHDLMIHDIDLVLCWLGAKPITIEATGLLDSGGVLCAAHAALTFENGSRVNLTADRWSESVARKMSVWQEREIIEIDFAASQLAVLRAGCSHAEPRRRFIESDPLFDELSAFADAVRQHRPVAVDGRAGLAALEVASAIRERALERQPELPLIQ